MILHSISHIGRNKQKNIFERRGPLSQQRHDRESVLSVPPSLSSQDLLFDVLCMCIDGDPKTHEEEIGLMDSELCSSTKDHIQSVGIIPSYLLSLSHRHPAEV